MPPRKKAESESTTEPERRSTRIRDAPPPKKPVAAAVAAAVPAAAKKVKKTDPELSEWKPSKKPAAKKRKKADVDVEDAQGAEDKAAADEDKPKKKTKTEPKAAKGKKLAAAKVDEVDGAKPATTARTERRKSGVVTIQPAIDEGDETKVEEDVVIIGGSMPPVTLKNEKGEDVETATLFKDTGVVIFAAPKADTPGCNKQACHYRDSAADFKKLGYSVYALTADTPAALLKWQTKNNLGYPMLSDPKRAFIKTIGAGSTTATKRSHFVFEKGTGKLLISSIGVKPDQSHASALEAIKAL